MKNSRLIISLFLSIALLIQLPVSAQLLPGFEMKNNTGEQERNIEGIQKDVTIRINAPVQLKNKAKTYLVIYALPNGNSIEWTMGKKTTTGDDWHFDIQHIAAQTRFIRNTNKKDNFIIVYLASQQKSWPTWRRVNENSGTMIREIVDSLLTMFNTYQPQLVLNGHSGGGSFIFGYLNSVTAIPPVVKRIAFLDSDYGYDDSLHKTKLVNWLKTDKRNTLVVLAYNDSNVIYNGKPLVSPTGGTWYRSRLMQRNLATEFKFITRQDSSFIQHFALKNQVSIILKENPAGLIYHTVQVEKNGFIYSMFANTKYDRRKYFTYFGERAYQQYIQ